MDAPVARYPAPTTRTKASAIPVSPFIIVPQDIVPKSVTGITRSARAAATIVMARAPASVPTAFTLSTLKALNISKRATATAPTPFAKVHNFMFPNMAIGIVISINAPATIPMAIAAPIAPNELNERIPSAITTNPKALPIAVILLASLGNSISLSALTGFTNRFIATAINIIAIPAPIVIPGFAPMILIATPIAISAPATATPPFFNFSSSISANF